MCVCVCVCECFYIMGMRDLTGLMQSSKTILWWWLHKSISLLHIIELHSWNGLVFWYVNHASIQLLKRRPRDCSIACADGEWQRGSETMNILWTQGRSSKLLMKGPDPPQHGPSPQRTPAKCSYHSLTNWRDAEGHRSPGFTFQLSPRMTAGFGQTTSPGQDLSCEK